MTFSNSITGQELEQAFQDDPEFGLALLHSEFRDQIARYIKSKMWGLPPGILREERFCGTLTGNACLCRRIRIRQSGLCRPSDCTSDSRGRRCRTMGRCREFTWATRPSLGRLSRRSQCYRSRAKFAESLLGCPVATLDR